MKKQIFENDMIVDDITNELRENLSNLSGALQHLVDTINLDSEEPLDDFDLSLARMATSHALSGHVDEWKYMLANPHKIERTDNDLAKWAEKFHLTIETAKILMLESVKNN